VPAGIVTVNKADLIAKIEANRDEHKDIVAKAQVNYRARVIEELDNRLADAKSGKPIDIQISLPMPTDYTREYDNALSQLQWEVADEVELDHDDFNRLVLNQWRWAAQFAGTSLAYANNSL
jgi:hypothetical protein